MSSQLIAQVEIDNSLIFTGSPANNTISNLGTPSDSTHLVTAEGVQFSQPIFASATGINNLSISLNPGISYYTPGMTVYVLAQNSNTDSVQISINGLAQKEVLNAMGLKLTPGEIESNSILQLTYNGTHFQLMNSKASKCPQGFTDVNDRYCIEINERAAANLVNAMSTCNDLNAKLCTWAEWYHACQKTSLALSNMLNNFELVDDTSNHAHTAVGVGSGSCTSQTANLGPATAYPYRCCFLKK
jgi:hypothetical protein